MQQTNAKFIFNDRVYPANVFFDALLRSGVNIDEKTLFTILNEMENNG